jgi:hypothetical protein
MLGSIPAKGAYMKYAAPSTNTDNGPEVAGGGWTLVRRTVIADNWNPTIQTMKGEANYGTFSPDWTAGEGFSVTYHSAHFDQFLLATGDLSNWLIVNKASVPGFKAGDPSFQSHGANAAMLFGEGNRLLGNLTTLLSEHKGANIFIRRKADAADGAATAAAANGAASAADGDGIDASEDATDDAAAPPVATHVEYYMDDDANEYDLIGVGDDDLVVDINGAADYYFPPGNKIVGSYPEYINDASDFINNDEINAENEKKIDWVEEDTIGNPGGKKISHTQVGAKAKAQAKNDQKKAVEENGPNIFTGNIFAVAAVLLFFLFCVIYNPMGKTSVDSDIAQGATPILPTDTGSML